MGKAEGTGARGWIYLRTRFTLPDYAVTFDEPRLDFGEIDGASVMLFKEEGSLRCEVTSERSDARVRGMLEALRDRRIPREAHTEHKEFLRELELHGGTATDEMGRLKPDFAFPGEAVPDAVRDLSESVRARHHGAAGKVVRLLRWITHRPGGHSWSQGSGATSWSANGIEWSGLFDTRTPIGWGFTPQELGADWARTLGTAARNGLREPLAHELWREAWDQLVPNPRSALVIGIAALEIGIRHHIAQIVPSVRWVMERSVLPAVDQLLAGYLPTLVPGRWRPLPREIRKMVKDGLEWRNEVVHRGAEPPTGRPLIALLETVREVLYLLDYQRGHDWALGYVHFGWGSLFPQGIKKTQPQ